MLSLLQREKGAWGKQFLQMDESMHVYDAIGTTVLSESSKIFFKSPGDPFCWLLLALMFDNCGDALGQLHI